MAKRVVIVEDDHIQSIALKLLLGKTGYSPAAICTSGASAIKNILKEKPDLIVSDIYLSDDVDGIAVAHAIRKEMDTPIIFITGQSRYEFGQRIESFENCDLLGKPVTLDELQRAVSRVMCGNKS
ncbi:MAG: response regulator [Balneolaceae bacterium]